DVRSCDELQDLRRFRPVYGKIRQLRRTALADEVENVRGEPAAGFIAGSSRERVSEHEHEPLAAGLADRGGGARRGGRSAERFAEPSPKSHREAAREEKRGARGDDARDGPQPE